MSTPSGLESCSKQKKSLKNNLEENIMEDRAKIPNRPFIKSRLYIFPNSGRQRRKVRLEKGIKIRYIDQKYDLPNKMELVKQQFKEQILSRNLIIKFSWTMEGFFIRDLVALSKSFRFLPSLQSLTLNLNRCDIRINKWELSDIGQNFKYLFCLKRLAIGFSNSCGIGDEGIIALIKGLVYLSSLQNLILKFNNYHSANEGLSYISQRFKSFCSLRKLDIQFRSITDEAFKILSKGLISLPLLQHLKLKFAMIYKFNDEELYSLSQNLKFLSSLQVIVLKLSGQNSQITDEGVTHIVKCFEFLSSLKKLSLDFGYCPQITTKGLRCICQGIKLLSSLRNLTLNLTSPNVTRKTKEKIVNSLKLQRPVKIFIS